MKINNSTQIEKIAVSSIKDIISKHIPEFEEHINDNDKGMSWDGEIYWLNNTEGKKDIIGTVKVQIKGKKVKELTKTQLKYSIQTKDLKNYKSEKKGTIYFVVEMTESETQIFYAELLPHRLNREIEDIKKADQKSKSITLKLLKNPEENLKYVIMNFIENSNKQINNNVLQIENINNKKLEIKLYSNKNNVYDWLLNNDIYGYSFDKEGKLKGYTPVIIDKIKFSISNTLRIGDKIYLDKIKCSKTKNDNYIYLTEGITISINSKTLNYNVVGNLDDRIKSLNMLLDLNKEKKIYINDNEILLNINLDDEYLKKINDLLNRYIELKNMFQKLNVNFNIKLEELSEEDVKKMDRLYELYKGSEKEKFPNILNLYNIEINKYNIAIIIFSEKDKKTKVVSFFSELGNMFYSKLKTIEEQYINTSPYIELTVEQLINYCNIDYEIVKKSFDNIAEVEILQGNITQFILNLLNAYDIKKVYKFLELAEYLNNKLVNLKEVDVSVLINKFQIIYRKRNLTSLEKDEIYKLKSTIKSNKEQGLCAIAILLGNNYDIKYYLKKMDSIKQEEFKKFPIYNLIK